MPIVLGPQASRRAPLEVARRHSVTRPSVTRRLAIAVAALFALTSVFAYASPSGASAWDKESFSSASAADLVALTNRSRANAGLRSLRVDSTLSSVARWRSKDMIDRDYFSHSIPGYGKVWDKLHAVGYCYKVAGENIGWNNYPDDIATAAIHDMFMNSSGHRANIMGKAWDRIGIGAYKGPDGKKMWTVLFADKCGTSTAPKPTAKPKPKPKPTARPTARPTAKPKPQPKPTAESRETAEPKPTPSPTVDPFLRDDPDADAPGGPEEALPVVEVTDPQPTEDGSTDSDDPESPDPGDGTAGDDTVGMRVVDDGRTDGLLQSIVGGVTGLLLGG